MKLRVPVKNHSIAPHLFSLSLEEAKKKFGLNNIIKMSSNENSWGASPLVVRALRSALQTQHRYPDGTASEVISLLAKKSGLQKEEFVVGNGSAEILELLVRTFVGPGDEVISSHPSFSLYTRYVAIQEGDSFMVPLKNYCHDLEAIESCISDKTRLILLDNPNNPTGMAIEPGALYRFLSQAPESVIVVLDEAYVDFMEDEFQIDIFSLIRNTDKRCGVVVVRTFSKLYGLAGLRIGYGLMPKEICELLQKIRQPYNVNSMALVGAAAALQDDNFYDAVRQQVIDGRDFLTREIEQTGCSCCASQSNFVFVDIKGDSDQLCESMLRKGFHVRSLKSFGLPLSIRVSVGKEDENKSFIKAFSNSLLELQYV